MIIHPSRSHRQHPALLPANRIALTADVGIDRHALFRFHNGFAHRLARPDVRFVNINVAGFDAAKHAGESVVADAREALVVLKKALAGWRCRSVS